MAPVTTASATISPPWNGLSVGASVGQGLFADVGFRYAADVGEAKIAAGVGYMNYTGTSTEHTVAGRRQFPNDPLLAPGRGLGCHPAAQWIECPGLGRLETALRDLLRQ